MLYLHRTPNRIDKRNHQSEYAKILDEKSFQDKWREKT